jgi:hypothetical protein
MGELDEAERFCSRALESRRAALGPDHPETADSIGKLGAAWLSILILIPPLPIYIFIFCRPSGS